MRPTCLLAAAALLAGCSTPYWMSLRSKEYVRPSIAVHSFTNRASLPAQWRIGDGMQELLINALLKTERFHVVERQDIGDVVAEIRVQQTTSFRPEGRTPTGRLMNVQYLVKGTIVDFGHVGAAQFAAGQRQVGHAFFGYQGETAVITMNLYVIEVASGRVVASEVLSESVRAQQVAAEVGYKKIGFGGSIFWQTPLGEACSRVLQKAVVRITEAVAANRWRPKVAKVMPDRIIINGGTDRDMALGAAFLVLGAPQKVLDPDNGEVIGLIPGEPVGRVVVLQVLPHCSIARIVEGNQFQVGQQLAPAGRDSAPTASALGSGTGAGPAG